MKEHSRKLLDKAIDSIEAAVSASHHTERELSAR